jgi:hypothetical protein
MANVLLIDIAEEPRIDEKAHPPRTKSSHLLPEKEQTKSK